MSSESGKIAVNPTLVAGLGGTGSMIATRAAEFTREACGGEVPFVRYLKLDTDDFEGDLSGDAADDFINLQDHMNLEEVVQDFFAGEHRYPHLRWLRGLRRDGSLTKYGCRGIPRLGRLVFSHVREKAIRPAVEARFHQLHDNRSSRLTGRMERFSVSSAGAPVVHVASSVCGGTGAGLLIDFAYNVQMWSEEMFGERAEIIAHLMLPDAFNVAPFLRTKLQAVAGVTLQQLEFLMDSRRESLVLPYREGTSKRPKEVPPFSVVYLLNGKAKEHDRLAALAGRMIRTRIVEPAGQRILSEENNKQQDILAAHDLRTGHRQCFCSYGLHCGRATVTRSKAVQSLCDEIRHMASGNTAAQGAYLKDAETRLNDELNVSKRCKDTVVPQPNWIRPSQHRNDDQALLKHIDQYVREKYLPQVQESLQRQADGRAPVAAETQRPLGTVRSIVHDDVFFGNSRPLNHVAACLDAWKTGLANWLDANRPDDSDPTVLIEEQVANQVRESLQGARVSRLRSSDVNAQIRAALEGEARRQKLAEVYVRQNMTKAVKGTLEQLRLKRLALDYLNVAAGCAPESEEDKEARERKEEDYGLATTLEADVSLGRGYAGGPEDQSEQERHRRQALDLQRRQSLLWPILSELVLMRHERDVEAEAISTGLWERLDGPLLQEIATVSDAAQKMESDVFHTPAEHDGKAIRTHPFSKAVTEIEESAEARISLHHELNYSQPLDVAIVQHVGKTCAMGILAREGEYYREALVDKDYERETENWLQIVRLRFGFCLESLRPMPRYTKSIGDYVARMNLGYESALWLDHRWYWAYQKALCEYQADADRVTRRAYMQDGEMGARIHELMLAAEKLVPACQKDAQSLGNVQLAFRVGKVLGEMAPKLEECVAELSSNTDMSETHEKVGDCSQVVANLEAELEKLAKSPPDTEFTEFAKACKEYKACLKRITETKRQQEGKARQADGGQPDGGQPDEPSPPATPGMPPDRGAFGTSPVGQKQSEEVDES